MRWTMEKSVNVSEGHKKSGATPSTHTHSDGALAVVPFGSAEWNARTNQNAD